MNRTCVVTGAASGIGQTTAALLRTSMVAGLMTNWVWLAATDARMPMPLGGHLQAGQVAAPLAWPTSEENSEVCGQTIYVDGGSEVLLLGDDVRSWNGPAVAASAAGWIGRRPPAG